MLIPRDVFCQRSHANITLGKKKEVYSLNVLNPFDRRTDRSCPRQAPLAAGVHVLPLVLQDLGGGEREVFVADVTVIHSGESGEGGRAGLLLSRL